MVLDPFAGSGTVFQSYLSPGLTNTSRASHEITSDFQSYLSPGLTVRVVRRDYKGDFFQSYLSPGLTAGTDNDAISDT